MAGNDHGTAAPSSSPTAGVSDGMCVLSLAEQLPGPFAGMLLADLGADVILVERPGGGPARAFPPVFQAMARNKRSVCIDLKSDNGKEQFEALARTADVVLEGFRSGVMDARRTRLRPVRVPGWRHAVSQHRTRGPFLAGAVPLAGPAGCGRAAGAAPDRPLGGAARADCCCSGRRHPRSLGRPPRCSRHSLVARARHRRHHSGPAFLARGLLSRQPEGDGTWFVRQPVKFSRYSTSLRRGAPALGEHTRQVLGGDAAACGELDGGGPQHVATDPRAGSNSKE